MSEKEKEQLKEEVLEEVRGLLADLRGGKPAPRGRRDLLNSPFVVTVLGGLLATGLTLIWQRSETRREHERLIRAESTSRKHALIADFPRRFSRSLDTMLAFRERSLWLHGRSPADDALYADGKDYKQTRQTYEALIERYLESGSADALCAQSLATFETREVIESVEALDATMDELITCRDVDRMYDLYAQADDQFQVAIRAMGVEVRRTDLVRD